MEVRTDLRLLQEVHQLPLLPIDSIAPLPPILQPWVCSLAEDLLTTGRSDYSTLVGHVEPAGATSKHNRDRRPGADTRGRHIDEPLLRPTGAVHTPSVLGHAILPSKMHTRLAFSVLSGDS